MSDTTLINALEKAGNVNIWRGYWQPHGEPRKDLFIIYRADDEGMPVLDEGEDAELSRGHTLREAIEKLP